MSSQTRSRRLTFVIPRLVILSGALLSACANHTDLAREISREVSQPAASTVKAARPPELVVQLSHSDYISAMALSPDGRFLVTASWDKTVWLWDAASGLEIRRLEGNPSVVIAASMSRDGRFALTGGKDGTARLWNTSDGTEILRATGHSGAVTTVAFSPDDSSFLTGGSDRTVRLWRRTDGRQIWVSEQFAGEVSSVAFTPDGRYALVGNHMVAQLWDVKKNKEVRSFKNHAGGVNSVAVSPCGRFVLTGSGDNTARLWAIDTGEEIKRFDGHSDSINTVAFSADGRLVLTASNDRTARLWEVSSAKEVRRFSDDAGVVSSAAISPDGRHVFTASQTTAYSWDTDDGRLVRSFKGNSDLVSAVTFSRDGHFFLMGSWDDSARLWDLTSGLQVRHLLGHKDDVRAVAFSLDDRFMLTGSRDGTARLWEKASGAELHSFTGHSKGVRPVSFSPDGQLILTGSDDGTVQLWQAGPPYAEVRRFGLGSDLVRSAVFSPDGGSVLTGSEKTPRLWDTGSGEEIRSFEGHSDIVNSVAFSPDGRFVLSASWDRTARLWDVKTGAEVRRLTGHFDSVSTGVFSPDGRLVLTGSRDHTVRLWDATNGQEVRLFQGHTSPVVDVTFSPDGRFILSAGEDQTTRLWDVSAGRELCRIVGFKDGSWAVVDPEGRFDASNGGDVDGLHWVVGMETIALSQLKERYYEPGLLAKWLGFNKDPIHPASALSADVALYPAIELRKPTAEDPTLGIKLTNRGGGIGKVIVWINGKEVDTDARGPSPNPDAQALQLQMNLGNQPYLIPGEENVIKVRALNKEGYLSSRGVRVVYEPPGQAPAEIPILWAIVVGISDYTGEQIDLHYAAKDANDMAKALQLGATRLFGVENVHTTLLTTTDSKSPPSKANIKQAFEKARAAKPWDILAVYFSGHGEAVGDTYYYLTQEAHSTDLIDPVVRNDVAISSEELVDWLRQSPALKQVMVLDTCAAGTAATKLVEKRDISSDQIRAIERLKDRTGFHVLMGSAADAVSYEATQYEQGLLTYALLQGMRGAALREEEYVDVSMLFQHAADTVPDLAQNIGGIQRPTIAAPKGTSFDIGRLKPEDRQQIPLAQSKPILLPPVLINSEVGFDNLDLTVKLRKHLRDQAYAVARGGAHPLPAVFVEADQLTGAIRPSGTYSVIEKRVQAHLVLVKDGQKITDFQVDGAGDDLDAFAIKMMERIMEVIQAAR